MADFLIINWFEREFDHGQKIDPDDIGMKMRKILLFR